MHTKMGADRVDLYTLDNIEGDYFVHDVHDRTTEGAESMLVWLGEQSARAFRDEVVAAWHGEKTQVGRLASALDRDGLSARLIRHPATRILDRLEVNETPYVCLDFPHHPRVLTVGEFRGFIRGLTGAPVGGPCN